MDAIFEFFNQPIVLTIITLTVGSFLLDLITERRARREKLRDKAIEFLTEAGDSINQLVPHIYAQLRTGNTLVDKAIREGMTKLFAQRMSILVGSQAFLDSVAFPQKYQILLDEIAAVVGSMGQLEQGAAPAEIVDKIRTQRSRLGDAWPLSDEELEPGDGLPVGELILWMDMILHRTTDLLSSQLMTVMR